MGDPWVDGSWLQHSKRWEREVVRWVAELFRAPVDDWWGYVTTGGTEGNLYGLNLARSRCPDGVVYLSAQAHPSIVKAASLLGMKQITVRVDPRGSMDYNDLAGQIECHRHRAVIVAATAGTTMSEAVDDLRRIQTVLDHACVPRRFVHLDAALSGIPLALLDPSARPGFDFADGADCVAVSGHKFMGTPMPCGVVVARHVHPAPDSLGGYAGTPDATITNSRSGHAPLLLWYALSTLGVDGLRARADAARHLAMELHARLSAIGWVAYRNPSAFTVALRTPPPMVIQKWALATRDGWSHIITMPGVTGEIIDEFLSDLQAAIRIARLPA